jgi:putative alpha-1,2-mannosidase
MWTAGIWAWTSKYINQKVLKDIRLIPLWDTFRSWYPLMTIIDPERSKKWAIDLYMQSLEGGLLPKWPLNGNYTGTMVGYPATAILADAFQKGILDTIPNELLNAAVTSSSWQQDFYETHQGTRAERVMPMHIYYKENWDLCL